ncbi:MULTISPECIES: nicotinamide mononucleotide deamidase-related protein [Acidiplasma]|jgi:nicotinamide-nucleotide amidase|uniref:Damage-inducible protein CinA n=2 Tax=Acidiplasma TaxID=507753 RepID=A0A0N8VKX7_9ARCH|nr:MULTISPECIES: nicotinamide mononucleotide deamidase-related protein [Acidiplasma]KJE49234.1 damage-inducible protein CinA [Acidiplasma sp. MBA-1]KPV46534.1 damage-inducible protein CinA [Acidiplasma aeolicum]KQB34597.1 damage-inducible protein CinA [Acidiplasma aeolicum]KQB34956.1 damage-inducible protein CinA [Acidiplasma cupricumulans]WMT54800.1 MAG: nicotinamide mononucleotide deamidase-related protein [Acidiplasma sp.]
MKAVIITIGNEILKGRTVNTNFSFIGKLLTFSGYNVSLGIIVPDNLDAIAAAFRNAAAYGDLIISSGGLGPTYDDMTLTGFARAFNLNLKLNETAFNMIKNKFDKITPEREKMAIIPEGSIPLKNDAGTAPGVYMEIDNKKYIILPGVPREVESIMNNFIEKIRIKNYVYLDESFTVNGIMESSLAPYIKNLMKDYGDMVYIKTHPKGNEIKSPVLEIEVSASGNDKNMVQETIKNVINMIKRDIDILQDKH